MVGGLAAGILSRPPWRRPHCGRRDGMAHLYPHRVKISVARAEYGWQSRLGTPRFARRQRTNAKVNMNSKNSLMVGVLAFSLCGTAIAQSIPVNDKDRDGFVRGCVRSCIVKTTSDPTAREWKMTETEVSTVCTCNCNEMGNRLTQDLADTLKDKDRATVKSSAAMQRISREAMDVCYPKFFESRGKE